MDLYNDTYLPDILHDIAQGLLTPVMVVIVALIVVTLFFLGAVIVEFFTERRYFKQNMPRIVNQINDAAYADVVDVVSASQLLRYQKAALITAARNMGLPEEPLFALAQIQIAQAERRCKSRLAWTDTISKVAPLLGLMGTLIPLGPGIVALGQNNVTLLSQSLTVAFDATVCGLTCAVVALIVSKVRSGWYGEYIESLESLMTCVLDKAATARKEGVELPANYDGDPLEEFKQLDRAGKGKPAAVSAGAKAGE